MSREPVEPRYNRASSSPPNGEIASQLESNKSLFRFEAVHILPRRDFELGWSIQNYSFLKQWKQALQSPDLTIPDGASHRKRSVWKIICEPLRQSRHPDRERVSNEDWIAIHVRRENTDANGDKDDTSFVFVRFVLTLLTPDGTEIQRRDTMEAVCFGTVDTDVVPRSSRQWGWERYVRQDQVLASLQAKPDAGDYIRIVCKMQMVVPNVRAGSWINPCKVSDSSFEHDMKDAYTQDNNYSDITIKSRDGMAFKAHKVILTQRSPVFKAMFGKNFVESDKDEVTFDFESTLVNYMLRFMYTDSTDFVEDMSGELVEELLRLSDMYGLIRLKDVCEGKLVNGLDINNVVSEEELLHYLHIADFYNAVALKRQAMRYMTTRYPSNMPELQAVATEIQLMSKGPCPPIPGRVKVDDLSKMC